MKLQMVAVPPHVVTEDKTGRLKLHPHAVVDRCIMAVIDDVTSSLEAVSFAGNSIATDAKAFCEDFTQANFLIGEHKTDSHFTETDRSQCLHDEIIRQSSTKESTEPVTDV